MAQTKERGIYNFATPRGGRVSLPWHLRNELRNYGWLDHRPCYGTGRFSISRWMQPDGGSELYAYDRVVVAFPPFGGRPLVCGVKEGKVTIL